MKKLAEISDVYSPIPMYGVCNVLYQARDDVCDRSVGGYAGYGGLEEGAEDLGLRRAFDIENTERVFAWG